MKRVKQAGKTNRTFLRVLIFRFKLQDLQGCQQTQREGLDGLLADVDLLFRFDFADDIAQQLQHAIASSKERQFDGSRLGTVHVIYLQQLGRLKSVKINSSEI